MAWAGSTSIRPRPSPRTYRRNLAHYLVAELQALVADPRATGRPHGRDLMAALPAEAALSCPGRIAYVLERGDGRAGRPAGFGYYRVRATDAPLADVHLRHAEQHLDLLFALSAERARRQVSRIGHSPTLPVQGELAGLAAADVGRWGGHWGGTVLGWLRERGRCRQPHACHHDRSGEYKSKSAAHRRHRTGVFPQVRNGPVDPADGQFGEHDRGSFPLDWLGSAAVLPGVPAGHCGLSGLCRQG